ncbi:protein-disulfide reductase DsbD domain-containing protein [Pedobacter ginsengisoli]|uniref:protein-disulfide reductase DsbD domain-containing protein n=1 Tax=Pedobacter ginsengisoli TaxID=363852 RepID=UPI00254DB5C5|nr:protein-disulfide reductase DsbD domain-containing protein [Pedobacter ginsengisoli]
MKRLMVLFCCMIMAFAVHAQIGKKANWKFTAKKLKPGLYEVHLAAEVQDGWNIYSQWTPKGGPQPTLITFSPNANILLGGKAKEVGRMRIKHEEVFGVDVHYFTGLVDFVQVIKLKIIRPDVIKGRISYMTCDDSQCITNEMEFSIVIK